MQHYARLATSPRLQRALKVLREAGGPVSTMELSRKARICATNSVVSELRNNGFKITCRQDCSDGQRRIFYTLIKEPDQDNA